MIIAIVILRLGAFTVGCLAFGIASYFGWEHAGWLLVPTVLAGVMCSSLGIWDDETRKDVMTAAKSP